MPENWLTQIWNNFFCWVCNWIQRFSSVISHAEMERVFHLCHNNNRPFILVAVCHRFRTFPLLWHILMFKSWAVMPILFSAITPPFYTLIFKALKNKSEREVIREEKGNTEERTEYELSLTTNNGLVFGEEHTIRKRETEETVNVVYRTQCFIKWFIPEKWQKFFVGKALNKRDIFLSYSSVNFDSVLQSVSRSSFGVSLFGSLIALAFHNSYPKPLSPTHSSHPLHNSHSLRVVNKKEIYSFLFCWLSFIISYFAEPIEPKEVKRREKSKKIIEEKCWEQN